MRTKNSSLKIKIVDNYLSNTLPDKRDFMRQLSSTNKILENENQKIRPVDKNRNSGGLINLKKDIPTIIVPDLHGRGDFLLNIIFSQQKGGKSIIEYLQDNEMQLVCIGDGMHAESRAIDRWKLAFDEFKIDYENSENMTKEMAESFFVMQTVVLLKSYFPENFHYLKGNHDNILNEEGNGNYPFAKFCYEGAMVEHFVKKFYGARFLDEYSRFERNLPLFCVGKNFLISHAQPAVYYSKKDIIEYRNNPEVIYGLTWTDNNSSQKGSVKLMIDHYLKDSLFLNKYYFGGHRPVNGRFRLFNEENHVQIHNPNKFIIVFLKPGMEIDLERDIMELNNNINSIINQREMVE